MIFDLFLPKKPISWVPLGVLRDPDKDYLNREWDKIRQLESLEKPSTLKEAVVLSDKLLDYALSQVSSGKNLGERLKNAKRLFTPLTYQKLWEAHKIRNAFVHDHAYEPTYRILKDAIEGFYFGLKELGVKI